MFSWRRIYWRGKSFLSVLMHCGSSDGTASCCCCCCCHRPRRSSSSSSSISSSSSSSSRSGNSRVVKMVATSWMAVRWLLIDDKLWVYIYLCWWLTAHLLKVKEMMDIDIESGSPPCSLSSRSSSCSSTIVIVSESKIRFGEWNSVVITADTRLVTMMIIQLWWYSFCAHQQQKNRSISKNWRHIDFVSVSSSTLYLSYPQRYQACYFISEWEGGRGNADDLMIYV